MISDMNTAVNSDHIDNHGPTATTRLCLATPRYYPEFSGAALRFKRYLPKLLARGIEPVIFAGTPTIEWAKASGVDPVWGHMPIGTLLPMEMVDGIPVYRVRLADTETRQRRIQYIRALTEFCRKEAKVDVIQHLSLFSFYIPWLYRLRRAGIPMTYVYTMVEDLPANPYYRAYRRQEMKIRHDLVDCITVSSSVAQSALREVNISTPIEVIPNGVDLQRYHPPIDQKERNAIRRQYGIAADDFLVITIGAVQPRKGTDMMVQAWSQLVKRKPQTHLMVVGPRIDSADAALDAFRRKIEEMVAASGAADHIHFIGHVDHVADYLRAADLFLFASTREGFGNVLVEAMATELPVLTTPFIGLPAELGQPDQHFIISPRDAAAFSDHMEGLLDNPQRRRQLGMQARRWVEKNMDLDLILDRYAELYHHLDKAVPRN